MASRRIAWFSCGAASAVAASITVSDHPDTLVIYCDTSKDEHPDNPRFCADVERWIGKKVLRISSKKYTGVEDVFGKRRYMSGPKGAICTTEMKKVPRFDFQEPDDIHVFGFTADEQSRIIRFEKNNHELNLEWPLRDWNISKLACYRKLQDVGIQLPEMYRLGYKNNNCIGCVKATSPSYWNKTRKHFPETFRRRAEQSREIGCRLVKLKGKRIFLDELEPEIDIFAPQEESISCGPECGVA